MPENLIARIDVFYDQHDGWGAIVTDADSRFKHISGHGEHPLTAVHELIVAVYGAVEVMNETESVQPTER